MEPNLAQGRVPENAEAAGIAPDRLIFSTFSRS